MTHFAITLTWSDSEDNDRLFRVLGTFIPPVAAYRRGHPDTWTPYESAEVEIDRIEPLDKIQHMDLYLGESTEFRDAVEEAILEVN